MQHLVDDHEVEGIVLHRQRVDVALAQLDAGEAGALEIGARNGEHCRARVDADGAKRAGRKELQHASGSGAEIEERLDGPLAHRLAHRRLHRLLGHVQRAQPVPLRGKPGEVRLRGPGPRLAHRRKPRPVGMEAAVARIDLADQPLDGGPDRVPVGEAEERPGALPVPLDEPGLDEELQVPRDARLRLAEDVGEVRDVELALGEERENAQAGLLAGRLEAGEQDVPAQDVRRRLALVRRRHKDMFI